MKSLKEIFSKLNINIDDSSNIFIKGIEIDSRKVTKGDIFVCISGITTDGHNYIEKAIENGASAIVVSKNYANKNIPVIKVDDTRKILGLLGREIYNSNGLNLIAITGTNGKTSTSYFLKNLLSSLNIKTGVIGTLGIESDEKINIPFETSTTPDSHQLHKILGEMKKNKVNTVVMEVTSQGLHQHRTAGCNFTVGILTNITQDHLDYHKTMENYVKAKLMLFENCENSVINSDSKYFEDFINSSKNVITYGIEKESDLYAKNIHYHSNSVNFDLVYHNTTRNVTINIPGKFTVYNALAAVGTLVKLNIDFEKIVNALPTLKNVPGRIENISTNPDYNVIVDYAHSPDGILNITKSAREFTKGRVITVFGCGGDRDSSKRPIMGKVAGENSDFCIITSDNPRSEDPKQIVKDVEIGIKNTCPYKIIVDRKNAIYQSVYMLEKGDTVIIAGKGHEDYQIFKDRTIHFDDREVAKEALVNNPLKKLCKPLRLSYILKSINSLSQLNDITIKSISTDSSLIGEDCLFVALNNGHNYIESALNNGAVAVVSEKGRTNIVSPKIIFVNNSIKAYGDIAMNYKSLFSIKLIGITGSVGKTTVKDMLAGMLSSKYNVLKTYGNQNNEIGLPHTIFNLKNDTDIVIAEMGMNDFGEIHRLSEIAKPDYAIITKIGAGHLEKLKSLEGVLQAKMEIVDFLNEKGILYLNNDDDLLKNTNFSVNTVRIGTKETPIQANCKGLLGTEIQINDTSFFIKAPGTHNINNFLLCYSCAKDLDLCNDDIKNGIKNIHLTKNRLEIINNDDTYIINDVYNSNPTSLMSSLDLLNTCKGEKIAIIGDMLELGEESQNLHSYIGEYCNSLNIDLLITYGDLSEETHKTYKGKKEHFSKKDLLENYTKDLNTNNKTILLKGSRGMKLETVVNILLNKEI
ncbi:MAG: UDP-N-acetylmuramoyl-L-alanyl-D-glutamate--2,6-diaminopimelate ligase [Lachnospirales bacterium]